jgi:hypothetical protein
VAATKDFRTYAFDADRVSASAIALGKGSYPKLYTIENLVRVLTHSVLVTQVGPDWWTEVVDTTIQGNVTRFMSDYGKRPWHGTPGGHEIYYAYLSDLSKIITFNSHLFIPIIPDIDQWILRFELIRIPRNIVGHMNWLSANDKKRIELTHDDLQKLIAKLTAAKSVTFVIP